MIRLLEINTERTWRGGERQTLYHLESFLKAGVEVELLARKGTPLARRVSEFECRVHEAATAGAAFFFLASKGNTYDIIHAQTARAQSLAVLAKPFHHTPILYTRRVDFIPRGWFSRWKYRKTDRIVAISGAIRDILERNGIAQADVIPSVVGERLPDREWAKRWLSENAPAGKKIVATVAALVPHKDPLTMVEVVSRLSIIRDDFIFFHFGDGTLRKRIESEVPARGLEGVYRLMGHVDGVEDLYPIFDVFVMSSSEEGLGSSVLDAFVNGVPVVATRAGGLAETVRDKGLLCSVGDADCLAESISRVLDDNTLRTGLVAKARESVLERHSIELSTEAYIRIFGEMISCSA